MTEKLIRFPLLQFDALHLSSDEKQRSGNSIAEKLKTNIRIVLAAVLFQEPRMRIFKDGFIGTLAIAGLLAAGMWYAQALDMQRWAQVAIHSGDVSRVAALPPISVSQVHWSADGQLLLALSRGEFSAEGFIAVYDTAQKSGRIPIDVMGQSIASAALAPDGRHVLASTYQGHLWWINLESFDSAWLAELPRPSRFGATAIAPAGRFVAAATDTGSIYLYDTAEQTLMMILSTDRRSSVGKLRFSPDGTQLLNCYNDGTIGLFDLATGTLLQEFKGHGPAVSGAEFLADGARIISVGFDDSVRIWEIASGREVWRGEFSLSGVKSLAVSADGKTAAWGGFSRKIIIWDLLRGQKKCEISTPASVVNNLNFSPDGMLLAAAGTEGTIRIYNLLTGAEEPGIDVGLPQNHGALHLNRGDLADDFIPAKPNSVPSKG